VHLLLVIRIYPHKHVTDTYFLHGKKKKKIVCFNNSLSHVARFLKSGRTVESGKAFGALSDIGWMQVRG